MPFGTDALALDARAKIDELSGALRSAVLERFRRRGIVVAVSGGVDSACVAALGVRALGPERVLALILPERDSHPESSALAQLVCGSLGLRPVVQDIAPTLEAVGCYRVRDAAVRAVFPAFEPGMPWKLALGPLNLTYLVVQAGTGGERRFRLPPDAYRAIVAATNYKQRTRKMIEYFHADRLHYAVAGTPNRLEYDQGFFVKHGDGAADVKPIAGLYKSQVYQLAHALGVPAPILERPPTSDTFSLAQSQEEFYFAVPYRELDLLLWAKNHAVPPDDAARGLGCPEARVRRVYDDIDRKRRAAAYQHAPPLLLEALDG